MKKIPLKNYVILAFLLLFTVIATISLANFYNNNLKKTTDIYKYANRLKRKEVLDYLDENPSVIIYVADKYDFTKEKEEKILKKRIIALNLYNNFVYIDKREFNDNLIKAFNQKYKTEIKTDNIPTILIYDEGICKIYYSVDTSILESLDFGDVR